MSKIIYLLLLLTLFSACGTLNKREIIIKGKGDKNENSKKITG